MMATHDMKIFMDSRRSLPPPPARAGSPQPAPVGKVRCLAKPATVDPSTNPSGGAEPAAGPAISEHSFHA